MQLLMLRTTMSLCFFLLLVDITCFQTALSSEISKAKLNVLEFGAKGDGITDDTRALQKALTKCSTFNMICKLPGNKTFVVTKSLFIWGGASLIGEDRTSVIDFMVLNSLYLFNLGISAKQKPEKPFTGEIANINFKVSAGIKGRILYFWRTIGAKIVNNLFEVGNYRYSATSSGNMNSWLSDIRLYIRKNILISNNIIIASSDYLGSEGIGLGSFDGAIISNNIIIGVGDDPIGVHYSENIKIINNFMTSVDGRLYVSNSMNVEIRNNNIQRIASRKNNKIYKGIALIYTGFELYYKKNSYSAPININIIGNELYYPPGSIDAGAGIYVYSPRNVNVVNNNIVNDSKSVTASAIHLLPAFFTKKWTDPDNIDMGNVARVWDVSILKNSIGGKFPQDIIMTGNCIDYMGNILIRDNMANNYQLYCFKKVIVSGNKKYIN